MLLFYGEELLALLPNPQSGGSLLISCLWLFVQHRATLHFWRLSSICNLEDPPYCDDRDPT